MIRRIHPTPIKKKKRRRRRKNAHAISNFLIIQEKKDTDIKRRKYTRKTESHGTKRSAHLCAIIMIIACLLHKNLPAKEANYARPLVLNKKEKHRVSGIIGPYLLFQLVR
jgi:hypothetical protein